MKRKDPLSKTDRSARMSLIRSKNTKPEIFVRQLVSKIGFRYRLHSKKLPGSPDLVLTKYQKVILVHGCFWHQHRNCKSYKMPRSRLNFWLPKLDGNRRRDVRNQRKLRSMGWRYLIVWECQIRKPDALIKRVSKFLKDIS